MAKKKTIFLLIVCISLTIFAGQSKRFPLKRPQYKHGMTNEEYKKEMENWHFQNRQQRLKKSEERMKVMAREAWKRLLRVNERQWKLIEPKNEKVGSLVYETWACALGWGGIEEQRFHWHRH